ncbi:MAG: hypothetical protein AAFV93_11060 [Chloroflexota bacterium]
MERIRLNIGSLIFKAILSVQSIAVITISLALFFLVGSFQLFGITFPAWIWLLIGFFVEVGVVVETSSRLIQASIVYGEYFEQICNPSKITNLRLRATVERALTYRREIVESYENATEDCKHIRKALDEMNNIILEIHHTALAIDALHDERYSNIPDVIAPVSQQSLLDYEPEAKETVKIRRTSQAQMKHNPLELAIKDANKQVKTLMNAVMDIHAEVFTT